MSLIATNTKRSAVIVNTLLFIVLSLFFLSVMESLEEGISALDIQGFLKFLDSNRVLLVGAFFAFISISFLMSFAPSIFLIFCVMSLYKSMTYFAIDFDKLILILSFVYIVLCYNYYQFLKLELQEPFYRPNFPQNIIPSYKNKLLPIIIKKSGIEYKAHLTNWGLNGFFCEFIEDVDMRGSIEIEVTIEGHSFFSEGVIVSRVTGGLGVRVRRSLIPNMGWIDFYGIINELGYKPY